MYVDKELLFTATAADLSSVGSSSQVYSDSSIYLGVVRDVGKGRPMYVVFCMDTALTSGNSTATMKFSVVDDDDATVAGDGVILVSTDDIVVTRLTLGKVIVLPLPAGVMTQKYLGVRFDGGTETTTAGTCTAFLALDAQTN